MKERGEGASPPLHNVGLDVLGKEFAKFLRVRLCDGRPKFSRDLISARQNNVVHTRTSYVDFKQ